MLHGELSQVESQILLPLALTAMEEKGLSKGEVARRTGIAVERIRRILNGKEGASNHTWDKILKATHYGLTVAEQEKADARKAWELAWDEAHEEARVREEKRLVRAKRQSRIIELAREMKVADDAKIGPKHPLEYYLSEAQQREAEEHRSGA